MTLHFFFARQVFAAAKIRRIVGINAGKREIVYNQSAILST